MVTVAGRAIRVIGFVTVGTLLVGCYTLQPTGRLDPEVGTKVALQVNDAGRAALGGTMGPEIDQVEGVFLQKENAEYVLSVSNVTLLRGGEQKWNGEKVHIKSEFVTAVYERKFSRSRSIAMGAAGLGAVAVIVTRSLLGAGKGVGPDKGGPSDTANTIRRRP